MSEVAQRLRERTMPVTTHPSAETLAAFARGDLPPAELSAVAEHIGGCNACCAALRGVPDDTFGNLARAAGAFAPAVATAGPVGDLALPGVTQPDFPAELADHPRYKLLSELGAGGMGVVYKAEHRIMDRVVALKVLAPHLTAKPGAAERFRKEVKLAARLNHANVVTVYDAEEAGGLLFLAMEFVEGASLDRLVTKKGPLAIPMACSFARQAAVGLQHAAERGVTHRDIKPQNLMVTRKGQIKVMDFGLARFVRNDDEEESPAAGRLPFGAGKPVSDPVTNPNLIMGTPDYLSPEQARNSHTVDHRSDIYSLGCTLYFLLTGRAPFSHASTLIDKLLAHTEETPPLVREVRPEVPDALAAVLAKMLAKNPDDRYASAGEVAAALAPFTRADLPEVVEAVMIAPPAALPVVTPPAAFDTAPVPDGPTVLEEERPRKSRKAKKARALPWWKKTWAKVVAVAVLGLLVAVAIAASRGKKDTGNPPDNTAKPPDGTPDPKGKQSPVPPGGTKPLPFLYVVPSTGVWERDYTPVVEDLEKGGVSVVTASGTGEPASRKDTPWKTIPVSKKLADVKASDYSGVAFCGYDVDEYVLGGPLTTAGVARRLIREMQQQNKPVAAICVGQRVLVNHDVLKGKRAARSQYLLDHFPGISAGGMMWVEERVVVALAREKGSPIITAAGPEDATEFARALLKAVKPE
jgi:serine/threonine protein kinase/putative intracellular protease/amidase